MWGGDPSPPGTHSHQIGNMAEQNQQPQRQGEEKEEMPDHPQFRQQRQEKDEGPVRRGDGTILKESDKPRNPKKKMWEENVESAKHEAVQQEAAAGSGEASVDTRTKDEL